MGKDTALLAASTILLVAFIAAGLFFGLWARNHGEAKVASAAVGTVHLDYMHAGWCKYCVNETSELKSVVAELSPHVSLSSWDGGLKANNSSVGEVYKKYMSEGLFGGYPTIVANSKSMLVGQRSRAEIKQWVCSQFEKKPAQCQ